MIKFIYIQFMAWMLISSVVIAKELCFPLFAPNKEEKELFQKMFHIQQKELATSILNRKTTFAKEYMKKYGLSPKDKSYLEILIKRYLANQYIKKLLEQNKPSDKEAKAYYLLHREKYKKLPFQSVKERIKEEMVQKKAIKIIEKEYKRLQNEQ